MEGLPEGKEGWQECRNRLGEHGNIRCKPFKIPVQTLEQDGIGELFPPTGQRSRDTKERRKSPKIGYTNNQRQGRADGHQGILRAKV